MDMSGIIQGQIDALPTSGSVPNASERNHFGGTVGLPSGELYMTKPLRVSSGVRLVGKGESATTLVYEGPDRFAIEVNDRGTGNGPFDVTLEGFGIRTKSAGGIGLARGLKGEPKRMRFENIVMSVAGTGIDLNGLAAGHVTYQTQIRNVAFYGPGAACIKGPMRLATLENVSVLGAWRGGIVPRAYIDLWSEGSTGTLHNVWVEGETPENCGFIRLQGGFSGYEGNWIMLGTWNEPGWTHGAPAISLHSVRLHADRLNAGVDQPILITQRSEVFANYLRATNNAGGEVALPRAFKCDATSRLYMRGDLMIGKAVA